MESYEQITTSAGRPGNTPAERFNSAVRMVLSVPKEENRIKKLRDKDVKKQTDPRVIWDAN